MERPSSPLFALAVAIGAGACTGSITDDPERTSIEPTAPTSESGSDDAGPPRGGDAAREDSAIAQDAAARGDSAIAEDASPSDSGAGVDAAKGVDAGPTDAGPTKPGDNRLVGYYANWTRSTMPPSSIPWAQLTHIAHAFVLPSATGSLRDLASYVDAELISAAHAHGVKVVASIGGAGASFAAMTSASGRAALIADAVTLCKTYGYDGADIDWEFPDASTGASWASLISELRTAFDAIDPKLTISAAIASGSYYGQHLPTPGLAALDWIGVMTYDYAGEWSATSGHDSPLFPSKGGDGGSVSESLDYMMKTRGLAAGKVLVGLPFYGHQFGTSSLDSTPVAPSTGMDYRDILPLIDKSGWSRAWDASAKVPYLSRPASPGFLSYDDAPSIREKCTYAKAKGVGGAIIWHLAGDRLSDGSNPLLTEAQGCR